MFLTTEVFLEFVKVAIDYICHSFDTQLLGWWWTNIKFLTWAYYGRLGL